MNSIRGQRHAQSTELIRWKIIDLAMAPGGCKPEHVHNRFDSKNRDRAKHIYQQMIQAGHLTPCRTGRATAYAATPQAVAEHAAMRATLAKTAPRYTPTLYHPSASHLPGMRPRYGAQPPVLPGGLIRGAEPPRPQPATPRAPGQLPPVTVCKGWTHDHRYQVAPGAIVTGEFSRLGVGRYIDGTA